MATFQRTSRPFPTAYDWVAWLNTHEQIERVALHDEELHLRPFEASDVDWLLKLCEHHPDLAREFTYPETGVPVDRVVLQALADLPEGRWGLGWVVQIPEPIGVVYALRDNNNVHWKIRGARIPLVKQTTFQQVRAIRLVADWTRETFDGTPFLAIPCGNQEYLALAERAGLPLVTETGSPPYLSADLRPPSMRRPPPWTERLGARTPEAEALLRRLGLTT
jgi:hypothetical protein